MTFRGYRGSKGNNAGGASSLLVGVLHSVNRAYGPYADVKAKATHLSAIFRGAKASASARRKTRSITLPDRPFDPESGT